MTSKTIESSGTAVSANEEPFGAAERRRFLFVNVGVEQFGIPINSVREVIEYTHVTSIPMCSEIIKGVINVRGSVVPIIDAAKRLMVGEIQPYDKYSCIVIYELRGNGDEESIILGILVNSVRSIESIVLDELAMPPSFGSKVPRHFIWKMTQLDSQFCALLDMENLLNIREINQLLRSGQEGYFLDYSR